MTKVSFPSPVRWAILLGLVGLIVALVIVPTLARAQTGATGTILREYWNNISGTAVTNLTSNANYPNNPSGSGQLTSLEGPTNAADNYGSRIRGYVHPPASGAYTFWLASDDSGELWLSTSDNPANATRIAYVDGWTNSREWTKFASQQSAAITLTAGQKYYIEVLQKEGTGGDNVAVAWQGPSLSQAVIAGAYLSPFGSQPSDSVSINAGGSATGSFLADQYFSGGSTYTNTATIDMSQIITNPPPAAVFNTERYGAMTYTIPNRSGAQTVTLYFAETYLTAAGQRLFNVSINGTSVLSNFDIYASAGSANRAVARTFSTTANSSGQVVIQFAAVTENPKINGISVAGGGVNPTQVPPTGIPPTGIPPTGIPPTGIPPSGVSINAGGSATGSFVADQYFSGGTTYTNTATIDMSQITTNPPPAAIFNTERYGAMTYTIPNRSGAQTVTLYFSENYVTAAGQRLFNVSINGTAALSNFDIFTAAGGQNRAIARTFNTTANSSGQVVIQFTAVTENPKISGITVAGGSVSTFTLTVTKAGSGSGTVSSSPAGINSCSSTCTASFPAGTSVSLTQSTASGSTFGGWSGACSGTGSCTVTMNTNQSVTATFNSSSIDIWNLPTFPVATGPYTADWTALGLAYSTPQWWRDAKFGAWAHWDPQSMPEQGDWYAYRMYQVGSADYNYHIAHFGDPSVYGYKDIAHNWVIDLWDPNALMDLYVQMGAKFFMAMGSHHDNFDNFNSTYQPWNSVQVGVQRDIVGTWAPIARQKGLRFGIGFHNTPARTWGQWMPIRYSNPAHSDALQTTADGTGKWWQGRNPADIYGPQHTTDCANNSCNNSAYGTQFMYRVDDAINKYHPDVVYFDDHAGDSQVDLGVHMGLGSIAPKILANYYNKSLTWNQGKMDVVMNMKGVGGQYNSFQNSPALLPYAERGLVRSTEAITESQISAYPFQTELDIQGGNWHYMTGAGYTGAASLVTTLMQNVSRNGSLLLNLTQRGRGNLDTQCIQIARDIGAWLTVNGQAMYASRPFEVWGDSTVLYTRNNGYVYATLLNWNGGAVTLSALKSGGATLGTVSKVEMLGSTVAMTFSQSASGLTVTPGGSVPALSGISDSQLASRIRVLRITHNKGRFNDDDPGASYPGWLRKSNLGTGDYNNDLTTSTTSGVVWTSTFSGTSVAVYAPKEVGAGSIEIQIDGQTRATVALSTTGARLPQQLVSQVTGLASGQHTISIINRGPGPVAVDAIVAQ